MYLTAALCVALPAFWLLLASKPYRDRQARLRAEGWVL